MTLTSQARERLMATSGPNLFHRLHKWAHRQDENFLTESLAVVLEQLLVLVPAVGTRLITHPTGGFIDLPSEDASAIKIHTQVEAVAGRPDSEVRSPNRLTWVEVKAESELRTGQLEGYRVLLKQAGVAHTKLVLLTRYPEAFDASDERPDLELRWFEIADGLETEIPAADEAGAVAGFLARQFLSFLEARSMTLAHVGKYMPEGLRALSNLMNMLIEASEACKVPLSKAVAWDYIGLYLDGGKFGGVRRALHERALRRFRAADAAFSRRFCHYAKLAGHHRKFWIGSILLRTRKAPLRDQLSH